MTVFAKLNELGNFAEVHRETDVVADGGDSLSLERHVQDIFFFYFVQHYLPYRLIFAAKYLESI